MRGAFLALAFASVLSGACSTAPPDPVLRGHYVWGAEVNTFQPCGSSDVYWVNAADTARFRMQNEYLALTTTPYEPVFLELSGTIGEVPSVSRSGFPGDYDGMITLSWVGEMRPSSRGDCE